MRNLLTFEWERDGSAHVDTIMPFFVLSINEFISDDTGSQKGRILKKVAIFFVRTLLSIDSSLKETIKL